MLKLPDVGVEYGITWIVEHLIEDNLTAINIDQTFEESPAIQSVKYSTV